LHRQRLLLFIAAMTKYLRKAIGLALACAFLATPLTNVRAEEGYSFKVENTTKNTIKKLLASPDGKKYGEFDIGAGIKPGETVTLKWDKKTDESNCEWYFKAVFDDKEESEAKEFDFCEDDLTLEF
jgi:hypothetical protein